MPTLRDLRTPYAGQGLLDAAPPLLPRPPPPLSLAGASAPLPLLPLSLPQPLLPLPLVGALRASSASPPLLALSSEPAGSDSSPSCSSAADIAGRKLPSRPPSETRSSPQPSLPAGYEGKAEEPEFSSFSAGSRRSSGSVANAPATDAGLQREAAPPSRPGSRGSPPPPPAPSPSSLPPLLLPLLLQQPQLPLAWPSSAWAQAPHAASSLREDAGAVASPAPLNAVASPAPLNVAAHASHTVARPSGAVKPAASAALTADPLPLAAHPALAHAVTLSQVEPLRRLLEQLAGAAAAARGVQPALTTFETGIALSAPRRSAFVPVSRTRV